MRRRSNQRGTARRWGPAVNTDADGLLERDGKGQKGFRSDGGDQRRLCRFCCILEILQVSQLKPSVQVEVQRTRVYYPKSSMV